MQSQTIRLPLRLIEKQYGSRSEIDVAADDVIECVNQVSEYPSQFRVDIGTDVSHENPWYHAMTCTISTTCTIERTSPETWIELRQLLVKKGLLE